MWDYATGLPFQHLQDIPQPGSLDAEAVSLAPGALKLTCRAFSVLPSTRPVPVSSLAVPIKLSRSTQRWHDKRIVLDVIVAVLPRWMRMDVCIPERMASRPGSPGTTILAALPKAARPVMPETAGRPGRG